METRKIQRVSHGTYTVSLPREWASEQELSAGDEVNIHPHLDGTLVVQPAEGERTQIEIQITDETPTQLTRLLEMAYAAGALEISVRADELSADQQGAVRNTARTLSGVTVAEESASHISIRNVLDSEQVSIRQSVRHLQFVALSHHREATAALCDPDAVTQTAGNNGHSDHLSTIVERYFVRSLSRLDEVDRLGEQRSDLFCFYRLADALSRIVAAADRIATVAADVGCLPADSDADLAATFESVAVDTRAAIETAADAVFESDLAAIWSVFERYDEIDEALDEVERQLFETPDTDYRTGRAVAALRQSAETATSIAMLALRRAIRSGYVTQELPPGNLSTEPGERAVSSHTED